MLAIGMGLPMGLLIRSWLAIGAIALGGTTIAILALGRCLSPWGVALKPGEVRILRIAVLCHGYLLQRFTSPIQA
jgi:hypothetical protein